VQVLILTLVLMAWWLRVISEEVIEITKYSLLKDILIKSSLSCKIQASISGLIEAGLIQSAHDVSDGGLMVTLAESSFPRKLGFDVQSDAAIRQDAFWFGEAQSRVLVSVDPSQKIPFEAKLNDSGTVYSALGIVKGTDLVADGQVLSSLDKAHTSYYTALETALMN
jgi:phosphoribosylformylglycinamidine synthase